VPDTANPEYWNKMEKLVDLNEKLLAIGKGDAPALVKKLQQAPIVERMVANIFQLFVMKPMEMGSVDVNEPAAVY
jgi:magnesium-protoporphyrin IX monomethyl ester (oxidative) cyclase